METLTLTAPATGQTEAQVRTALRKQYPNHRIAGLVQADDEWQIYLKEKARKVHQRTAAPPPPDGDSDDILPPTPPGKGDDEAHEDEPEGSDEDKKEESDEPKDPAEEIKSLLPKLKSLIDGLEKVVGPSDEDMPTDEDMPPDLPSLGPDAGPHMPPGGGMPPGAGPKGPPHRPGIPGGRKPGGPPVGVPTFTKRKAQVLQRVADVSEQEAKDEIARELPGYVLAKTQDGRDDFKKVGNMYVARVVLKES